MLKRAIFLGLSLGLLPVGNAFAASVSAANGAILSGWEDAAIVRGDREIQPVAGMQLYPGDRLAVRSGEVLIQCTDLAVKAVTQEQVNPCLANVETKCNPELRGCPDRGQLLALANPNIPYIISPRNGKLFNLQPLLRWHSVAGADRYRVIVEGGGMEWEQETQETQIRYVGEALQLGGEYFLTVEIEAEGGIWQRDVQKFTMLDPSLAQQVQAKANLAEMMPSEEAKVLATVGVYLQYDLTADAIGLLEGLIASGMDNAAIRLWLGNLYLHHLLVALPALEHYQQAIQLVAEENLEDRSQIEEGLGLVYVALKNTDEAIRWLTRARSSYEALGDSQRARELSQKITELSSDG